MKALLGFLAIASVRSYELFESRWSNQTFQFYPCENLGDALWRSAQHSATTLEGIVNIDLIRQIQPLGENRINTICTTDQSFGYTRLYMPNNTITEADIFVNPVLFGNNAANVMLHEMLHAVGLNHSDEPGIMNYSLRMDQNQQILSDPLMYLSPDDLRGLRALKITTTSCPKKRIYNLLKQC